MTKRPSGVILVVTKWSFGSVVHNMVQGSTGFLASESLQCEHTAVCSVFLEEKKEKIRATEAHVHK